MKQLLFLLLFPCLALAQYTGNAGQKITLGEQTTADGLVYRGLAADTTRKPSVDTMAYILLDTNTNIIWQYKKAVNNAWTRLGGSISSGVTGVLPVANGGTNRTTMPAGYILHGDGTSIDTAVGLFWDRTYSRLGFGTNLPNSLLHLKSTSTFININMEGGKVGDVAWLLMSGYPNAGDFTVRQSDVDDWLTIKKTNGYIGISNSSPTEKLHVVGNARISAMNGIGDIGADGNGVLQAAGVSDVNLKNTIENSSFGLNEILLLNPVTFLYNDENRKIDSDVKDVGFIAQDVFDIIPNAVSSMGDGYLQINYRAITATLVKAIQEQNLFIKALEQRILILENK